MGSGHGRDTEPTPAFLRTRSRRSFANLAATHESRPPVRDRFSVLGPEIVWWYRARCPLVRQRGQLGTSFRKAATLFAVFALQASRSTAPARPTGIPAISGISGRTFATRRPRHMRRACSSAWRRWRGARAQIFRLSATRLAAMTFEAYLDNIKAKTGKSPADFRKLVLS